MNDAERQEVREWCREQRRVRPLPDQFVVSPAFYRRLQEFLYDQADLLGSDIASFDGGLMFMRIPVIEDSPHLPFLRAIIAQPGIDALRLIYADWLDEHGESARAEFIRVQCELARTEPSLSLPACAPERWSDPRERARIFPENPRWGTLCRRERELLGSMTDCLAAEIGEVVPFADRVLIVLSHPVRGFVEELALDWEACSAHLDAIRQRTPIRKVRLTTWPEVTVDSGEVGFRLFGRLTLHDSEISVALKTEWPGIEFELPPRTPTFGGRPIVTVGDLEAAGLTVPVGVRHVDMPELVGPGMGQSARNVFILDEPSALAGQGGGVQDGGE